MSCDAVPQVLPLPLTVKTSKVAGDAVKHSHGGEVPFTPGQPISTPVRNVPWGWNSSQMPKGSQGFGGMHNAPFMIPSGSPMAPPASMMFPQQQFADSFHPLFSGFMPIVPSQPMMTSAAAPTMQTPPQTQHRPSDRMRQQQQPQQQPSNQPFSMQHQQQQHGYHHHIQQQRRMSSSGSAQSMNTSPIQQQQPAVASLAGLASAQANSYHSFAQQPQLSDANLAQYLAAAQLSMNNQYGQAAQNAAAAASLLMMQQQQAPQDLALQQLANSIVASSRMAAAGMPNLSAAAMSAMAMNMVPAHNAMPIGMDAPASTSAMDSILSAADAMASLQLLAAQNPLLAQQNLRAAMAAAAASAAASPASASLAHAQAPRMPKPRRTMAEPRYGPDGQARLNARQRRTLRRAKERAIRGLLEAGQLMVAQSGADEGDVVSDDVDDHDHTDEANTDDLERSSDCSDLHERDDGVASPTESHTTSSSSNNSVLSDPISASSVRHLGAGLSFANSPASHSPMVPGSPPLMHAGEHGRLLSAEGVAEAMRKGMEASRDVTLPGAGGANGKGGAVGECGGSGLMEDMDISNLIAKLTLKKEEGRGVVDDKLIRDLQIIQNLLGVLKVPVPGVQAPPPRKSGAGVGVPSAMHLPKAKGISMMAAVH